MTREEAISQLISLNEEDVNVYSDAVEYAIEALEQEPCEDCISRQAAIDAVRRIGMRKCSTNEIEAVSECERAVEALPPVTLQLKQRTGRWIDEFGGCKCSECGCLKAGYSDYCPNCGIKMEVQDADSD